MSRKLIAAIAAGAFLISGQAALAADTAQISGLKGEVMVTRDGKLTAAAPGALKAGDRIVAKTGSEARVTYGDGCVVTLKPEAMATIGAQSPCAGGAGLVSAGQSSAQLTTMQWVGVGLTVLVLGIGIAAALDDDDPISN